MKSAQQQISRGFVLDGRYEIIEALGQGGMAYVYLAFDREMNREVAVKLMRDELSDDPDFIKRFATEARAAASLDHPNIVQVLDYGQDGDVRYIVQEYVEGTNLKELIQNRGPLNWDLAVPLMMQIGMGLEHAHRRGIIHRDMKPQNVLITPDMIAKVTDFGIARASIANTITLTGGMAFGSVHYFSPEQARGGTVTERSDLYSLGLMLYEMVTGQLPFDGDSSVAVAIKQLQEMPMRPSKVNHRIPLGLDIIIFKAIQKSPERRFESAHEFVNELDRFMIDPRAYYASFPPQSQNWSSSSAALTTDKGDTNYGKIEEIERNIDRRRRTKLRDYFLTTILVLLAIAGIGFLIKSAVNNFSLEPPSAVDDEIIVVERYLGKQVHDIEDELREIYGENYELIPVKSETQEKGIVFEQTPNYGTKLDTATGFLTLKYSVGKDKKEIPEGLVGMNEEQASSKLRDLGLNVVTRQEVSDEVPKGEVIRTEPQAGSQVFDGARIILFVSRGNEKVVVPGIVSLSWAEAKETLDKVGLLLKGESIHRNAQGEIEEVPEANRVILRQNTGKDLEVNNGSTLYVEYGDSTDYQMLLMGLDPAAPPTEPTETQQEQEQTADAEKDLTIGPIPNLLGMTVDEVRNQLSFIWPEGAPPYYLVTQGSATSISQEGAVVVSQSISPNNMLNPYQEDFYIFFDVK